MTVSTLMVPVSRSDIEISVIGIADRSAKKYEQLNKIYIEILNSNNINKMYLFDHVTVNMLSAKRQALIMFV